MTRPTASSTSSSVVARLAAPIGVLIAPRRTGRVIAHSHLASAIAVHLLALLLVGAVAVFAAALVQRLDTGPAGSSTLSTLGDLLRGTLTGRRTGLPISGFAETILLTFIVGEVFYWATAIIVLAAWTGLNAQPTRLFGRATVLAGYASMWLAPMVASWAAGVWLFACWSTLVGAASVTLDLLLGVAGLCAGVLPAVMLVPALRLAQGAGDVLAGDPPPPDKQCERCGYNLHATGFDGTCPECGLPARHSLSPVYRSNRWETRRAGYLRTMVAVIAKPGQTFSGIRVDDSLDRARRFLWCSTALSTGLLAVLIGVAASRPDVPVIVHPLLTPLLYAGAWAAAVPILSMFAAGILSGGARRRGDRLRPRGATKIACYLSAVAVPWAFIIGCLAVFVLEAQSRGLMPRTLDVSYKLLAAFIALGMALWYWHTAAQAYTSCRYANT